jgi:hypothetical protein
MAQEPSSKDLLEAVKQQESGGRRYKADGKTLLEGPQTKYGTAKGEMQVLDMTNRDPGFGVRPAKDDSADERARVGRDYLAAMKKRYGNTETALVAYNWGPGNTDNWLKKGGDFAKLPAETQNYVTKITGSLGSTKVAQAPAKAAPVKAGIQKTAFNPAQNPMFAQLGPSYQAAFAVSMLADEGEKEGKSEDEPSESEKMLMEATARPVALASADLSYQSPFPELNTKKQQQPIGMAAGGVPYVPTPTVRGSAKRELADVKSQWDAYNAKAGSYNTDVDAYNAANQQYNTDADTYNTAQRRHDTDLADWTQRYRAYMSNPRARPGLQHWLISNPKPQFSLTAPTLPTLTAPVQPTQPTVSAEQYQAMAQAARKDVARRGMAMAVAANPEQFGISLNKFFAEGGEVDATYGGEVEGMEEDPQMMADKTTELQGFTTRQPDGTGTLWGPDVPVSRSAKELKAYTEAMNPAVKTFTGGLGMGTRGYIYADQPDIINLNTALTPGEREVTMLHELEHSMDARGGDIYGRPNFAKMGGMDNNYRAYTLMGNRWDSVEDTVKNMVDNREKLEKFFGRPLDNSYFRKDSYDNLNKVGKTKAMFSEQLASLSALEQTTGKFLTQDPEMRELFPNTKMMAVYDALTGPRQTRMDARDLPPHTPVPSYTYQQNPALRFIQKTLTGENEYGTSYRPFPIKRANGGEVDYFQDPMGAPSAPVTQDTFVKGKEFKAADALKLAKDFGIALASNTESLVRGAVAQVPGVVGDVESLSRKGINFLYGPGGVNVSEKTVAPTSEEIRARVPRITDPRPESSGMESMGEMMAPGLGKAAAPVAKAAADKVGEAAKMLKKVPPAPAPMAGPTPEVQTELAQLTEQRGLPRNAGQAPDPLIGVRPTVEEAQANVAARQAEQLPPPPAEVAVPPEMLEMPPVAAPMQVGVPADRPFVGRLDAFVDTIKNPVQLGQLKGQLKGKFRDYDVERVERAFAGMDDKTKLTPDQIKQALAGTHSPSKWISETLPPKAGEYSQTADNVWGKELGTTNLYLKQPAEKELLFNTYAELKDALTEFVENSAAQPTVLGLEKMKKALNDQKIEEVVGTELVAKLKSNFNKAEKNIRLVDKYDYQIYNIKMGFTRPVLYKTGELSVKYQTDNQPFFKYQQEFMDNLVTETQERLIQQGGITPVTAKTNAMNEVYNSPNFTQTYRQSEIYAMKKVQELALADARNLGIDSPNLALVDWTGYETGISSYPTATNAFTKSVDDVLEPSIVTLHEANKQVQRLLSDDIKQFSKVLKNEGAYRPDRHGSIAPGPHPIGFTRFSEHETTVPGMGTIEGRHFHELQSDLSKDMRTKGATFGSAAKDQAEYDKLINQIKQTRDPITDELRVLEQEKIRGISSGQLSNTRYQEIEERQKTLRKIFNAEIKPLEKRVNILIGRLNDKTPYSLEEPFAGFETNQMARQQLLMKNAIQAAMRDGKRFATFPGKESDQPQLYVGKVLPNLKQIIRDLGGEKAGFELRQIELPPDKKGNPITAIGVVWSPEAAARIVEKGVPFAKGGSVERLSADNRRYL